MPSRFEPREHLAHVLVGEPHRIEISRPVAQQHRVARVVRRAASTFSGSVALPSSALARSRKAARASSLPPRSLPPWSCTCMKNGCPACARPSRGVVHRRDPIRSCSRSCPDGFWTAATSVSCLPFRPGLLRTAARGDPVGQAAADAGVVAGLLEERRHRLDALGQMNLQLAAPAAVMMGADGGLIHPGDQRRPAGRADRRGDEGAGEPRALRARAGPRAGVSISGLAVAGEIRRHVVDDEPEDVRAFGFAGEGSEQRDAEEGENEMDQWFHGMDLILVYLDDLPSPRRQGRSWAGRAETAKAFTCPPVPCSPLLRDRGTANCRAARIHRTVRAIPGEVPCPKSGPLS